jgi:hypothetical protein
MANEARVTCSIAIRKDGMDFKESATYLSDISVARGPSPGYLTATVGGTDIDVSKLTQPSLCWIRNLEAAGGNYVTFGIYDPSITRFHPLIEVRASEAVAFRLSRALLEEYFGTGTGTTSPENTFRVKANGASCRVFVGAFDD